LWAGEPISHSDSWFAGLFHLSRTQIVIALGIYGFAASMLPVWLLLSPRGYLSSFTKIGTIFLLAIGVIIVNPELKMPALSEYTGGGGPIVPGPLFPFCFITIACGAISGFHALISSGTTPKMIDRESDIRPVGYGAMLIEGVVGIMALIAAASMAPGDYFAINVPPATYANLVFEGQQMAPVNVPGIEAAVGETVTGRTGGAVSLAVGMAQIFSALPGMQGLLAYWYHFAIMFEALFILTTIDSGTRVGRFLLQEFMGRAYAPLARHDNIFAGSLATLIMVFSWGYFIYTGQINTIWPMFAVGNQLLASVALAVATSILINLGRAKYIWVTLLPLAFLGINTLYGGVLNITGNYYPLAVGADTARNLEGWILTICTAVMIVLALVILGSAIQKWISVLSGGQVPATAERA
jgi:carbon starvation protein